MITVSYLSAGYSRPIVEDVNLEIPSGTLHGIVGPNGAGKSTLLTVLAGLKRPITGEVQIDGIDVFQVPIKQRAHILAYMPQDTHVHGDLTVQEVVELGRYAHRSRFGSSRLDSGEKELVAFALELVGLLDLTARSIKELSGGQRQLVLLAKALAQDTSVLFADEPVSALDIKYQLTVLELLRDFARRGKTAVVVLHDLNLAARYCDEISLVAQGHLSVTGKPETVFTEQVLREFFEINTAVDLDPATAAPRITALGKSSKH